MKHWKGLATALALFLALICALSLPDSGREVSQNPLPPLVTVPGTPAPPVKDPIDLNAADLTRLMTLPEIGETRANAIIAYRETYGPFRSVSELAAVPGIGPGVLELVREYVWVEQAPD